MAIGPCQSVRLGQRKTFVLREVSRHAYRDTGVCATASPISGFKRETGGAGARNRGRWRGDRRTNEANLAKETFKMRTPGPGLRRAFRTNEPNLPRSWAENDGRDAKQSQFCVGVS